MMRTAQIKRGGIGTQTPKMVQYDIQKPPKLGRMDTRLKSVFVQDGQMGTGCCSGEGIFDVARGLTKMGARLLDGTAEKTARPGFPGEHHAMLKLQDGTIGRANYMGPGTQVVKRIRRRDPPRTVSDRVSQAHDIRYGLARNQRQVRKADKRMVRKLKKVEAAGQDSRWNTQPAMRAIQAKIAAEKSGLIKPGRIASFGGVKGPDRRLLQQKLAQLEQGGFGLPGDLLKQRLLTTMTRKKQVVGSQHRRRKQAPRRRARKRGSGTSLPGGGLSLPGQGKFNPGQMIARMARTLQHQAFPSLLKHLAIGSHRGRGLKLAGQGVPKLKLRKLLNRRMLAAFNDGASRSKILPGSKGHVVGKGPKLKKFGRSLKGFFKKLQPMAKAAAKVLLPIVIAMVKKKIEGEGQAGRGAEAFADFQHRMNNPGVFARLSTHLTNALLAILKGAAKGKKGSGLMGSGPKAKAFWRNFKKGFMSVINPALKVAKTVAPLVPLLL